MRFSLGVLSRFGQWPGMGQLLTLPRFARYIGIDYSGACTSECRLRGLRVFEATRGGAPVEVRPEPPRRYFCRREVAEWLAEQFRSGPPALVGIDHGFGFPLAYFKKHGLPHDWLHFLEDFRQHWPTDNARYVSAIREGHHGNAAARTGSARWRRRTEIRAGTAKSVFHFDCQGQVAQSTHAGLPWLLRLKRAFPERLHVWPFDGWDPPPGSHVVAEVYPRRFVPEVEPPEESVDEHGRDAHAVAAWLRGADGDGRLAEALRPPSSAEDEAAGRIEGWIFGVRGPAAPPA